MIYISLFKTISLRSLLCNIEKIEIDKSDKKITLNEKPIQKIYDFITKNTFEAKLKSTKF